MRIPDVVFKSVVRIIEHLGREGYYPTSQLRKLRVDDATVAAICTGVWTILAHGSSSTGTRFASTLLSLQLIILLLNQCGGRVPMWLDMQRGQGELGRYLRWSMVVFKFCGYDETTQEPLLILKVDSNASKKAARLGDWLLHLNTFVSKPGTPKSKDIGFSFVALAFVQGLFPDMKRVSDDVNHGKQLLARQSAGFYEFTGSHALPLMPHIDACRGHICRRHPPKGQEAL